MYSVDFLAPELITAQSNLTTRFIYLVESIKQRKIFHSIRESVIHDFFSYIEIWENFGDLTSQNYQGTILNAPDDPAFEGYCWGEIIRMKRSQCNALNP